MNNKQKFKEAFTGALRINVVRNPDLYAWSADDFEEVCNRMFDAIDRMSFNKDSQSFKDACKALGIKHTYKAIKEFINQ